MNKINLLFLSVTLSFFLVSCNAPDPEPEPYESGVVVLNAGNFTDNNGTLSFIQNRGIMASTDIFKTVNTRPLTGGVQGYTEIDGKGVILVDNSTAGQDKVELVEINTFKSLGTLLLPTLKIRAMWCRWGQTKPI